MSEVEFINEVRCRSGELPQDIGKTIDRIYVRSQYEIFNIDHAFEDIIELIDKRAACTSDEAFRILFGERR